MFHNPDNLVPWTSLWSNNRKRGNSRASLGLANGRIAPILTDRSLHSSFLSSNLFRRNLVAEIICCSKDDEIGDVDSPLQENFLPLACINLDQQHYRASN